MPAATFEQALGEVFVRGEEALAARLSREKVRANNLQAEDTRRYAYLLAEAIEHEIQPVVGKALAAYDIAIDRPLRPELRWEEAIRRRIAHAVEAGVRLAEATSTGPWRPLLDEEAPHIEVRLTALADKHFAALGQLERRRRRRSGAHALRELLLRLALFAAGLACGAGLARALLG